MLLNYPTGSVIQGKISFGVEVCNNQAAPWTSTLDFTSQAYSGFVTIVDGTYVAASGFHSINLGAGNLGYIELHIAFAAATLTQISLYYNSTANGSGANNEVECLASVGGRFGALQAVFIGNNIFVAVDNRGGITSFNPSLDSGNTAATMILSKIVIQGTGPKPSPLP